MEDSFFGFDTSVPLDEVGGGQIAEPSEEEYDALNDETFGSATNGDWEEVHENLVRMTDNVGSVCARNSRDRRIAGFEDRRFYASTGSSRGSPPSRALTNLRQRQTDRNNDSDLELNLSSMKLDDVDISFDDSGSIGDGGNIRMDPSVWASHPMKPNIINSDSSRDRGIIFGNVRNAKMGNDFVTNPAEFLREHFSSPFQLQQRIKPEVNSRSNSSIGLPQFSHSTITPKICTLEDVERNLIIQQAMQKHQQLRQQEFQQLKQPHPLNEGFQTPSKTPTLIQQQQYLQKQQPLHQKIPTDFGSSQPLPRPSNNFANNVAQHSLLPQQQSNMVGNRLPPGIPLYPPGLAPQLQHPLHGQLPPHPLLNQHGMPPNFPHSHPRPVPNPHLPIALNNFAMHPNFNAMRAAAAAAGIHPAALIPPPQQAPRLPSHLPSPVPLLNHQQPNSMYNMFNMRLVQEIQQNHPLLQNAIRQTQQQNIVGSNSTLQQQQQRSGSIKLNQHRRDGGSANGNLPYEEYDDYANLMSTRDKHWLIGIQLSQLNTDTPYIDDFYYTVYRERKAILSGNVRHSQAHKDNQLNHPLTQPKGHAQLILVQLGSKNGTRNGQQRERRNSEVGSGGFSLSGHDQKAPYVFTPLKFENSLGKLQYGSVTAPRKIIDAEIMSGDLSNEGINNTHLGLTQYNSIDATAALSPSSAGGIGGDTTTSSAQRKSRHILLHIETLYRIVLKLEDLDNPNAIATIIMKKKKESERIAALEQLENINKTAEERAEEVSNPNMMNPALKHKFPYEIEKREALIAQLIAGLSHDKVVAMMNVRKGKVLIRRIMPYIDVYDIRWNVWIGVFSSLQNVVKKDREDLEGVLYALYAEFKKQIKKADFELIVKISSAIPLTDKKSNSAFCSRFGISSLVCLILQAEQIYMTRDDSTFTDIYKEKWRQFLKHVATSLNRTIQSQTICAAIESDSIQPIMNHFARFRDLKLDSLLALITEAKQQIN